MSAHYIEVAAFFGILSIISLLFSAYFSIVKKWWGVAADFFVGGLCFVAIQGGALYVAKVSGYFVPFILALGGLYVVYLLDKKQKSEE